MSAKEQEQVQQLEQEEEGEQEEQKQGQQESDEAPVHEIKLKTIQILPEIDETVQQNNENLNSVSKLQN